MKTSRTSQERSKRPGKTSAVRESRIVFFGSPNDPEVQESRRRAEISGRATEVIARPSHDTGMGPCGKHLCSCKAVCLAKYSELEDQYGMNSTGFSF